MAINFDPLELANVAQAVGKALAGGPEVDKSAFKIWENLTPSGKTIVAQHLAMEKTALDGLVKERLKIVDIEGKSRLLREKVQGGTPGAFASQQSQAVGILEKTARAEMPGFVRGARPQPFNQTISRIASIGTPVAAATAASLRSEANRQRSEAIGLRQRQPATFRGVEPGRQILPVSRIRAAEAQNFATLGRTRPELPGELKGGKKAAQSFAGAARAKTAASSAQAAAKAASRGALMKGLKNVGIGGGIGAGAAFLLPQILAGIVGGGRSALSSIRGDQPDMPPGVQMQMMQQLMQAQQGGAGGGISRQLMDLNRLLRAIQTMTDMQNAAVPPIGSQVI